MITFGIFALNEEKHIAGTVEVIIEASKAYPDTPFEIIIVDDGSTDNTYNEMQKLAEKYDVVRPLQHKKNLGIGASAKTIIHAAKFPKLGFFPGDNVVSCPMFESFFKYCGEDFFVCYYFVNTEVRSKLRIILSSAYTHICMLLFNTHLTYINGGGIYPTELLKNMNIRSEGYTFILELTAKTLFTGVRFFEVPAFFLPNHDKSVALKITNIIKTLYYLSVVYWDIKIKNKHLYNKAPERVLRF